MGRIVVFLFFGLMVSLGYFATAQSIKGAAPSIRTVSNDTSTTITKAFESSKGKLQMPLQGGKIMLFDGRSTSSVPTLEDYAMDIKVNADYNVRSVFYGQVEAVLNVEGMHKMVLVKHGLYYTVYANLSKVFVQKGDMVKKNDLIGLVFRDPSTNQGILHFQIWHKNAKLQPNEWIKIS